MLATHPLSAPRSALWENLSTIMKTPDDRAADLLAVCTSILLITELVACRLSIAELGAHQASPHRRACISVKRQQQLL